LVVGAAGLGDTGRQGLGELSLTSGALTLDVGGGAARAGDGLDQAGKLGSTSACGSGDKAPCTQGETYSALRHAGQVLGARQGKRGGESNNGGLETHDGGLGGGGGVSWE